MRKSPSTVGTVLGTFKSGQEITVLSIDGGWAKVEFNNSVGNVSAKYITELPKKIVEEPQKEEEVSRPVVEEPIKKEEEPIYVESKINYDTEIDTPLQIGSSLSDNFNLYLAVQGGFGWSNFLWSDGSVNGTMAYSGNIMAQLYFEDTSVS